MKPTIYVRRSTRSWNDYLFAGLLATMGLAIFYGTVELGRALLFR